MEKSRWPMGDLATKAVGAVPVSFHSASCCSAFGLKECFKECFKGSSVLRALHYMNSGSFNHLGGERRQIWGCYEPPLQADVPLNIVCPIIRTSVELKMSIIPSVRPLPLPLLKKSYGEMCWFTVTAHKPKGLRMLMLWW